MLAAGLLLGLLARGGAFPAAEGGGEVGHEPEPCRAALAARPDDAPLQALRAAESERWREARRASRQVRRLLGRSLGAPDRGGSRAIALELARVGERHRAVMREARALCGCRVARGDPDDADCARLYPSPPEEVPVAPPESQRTPSAASPEESGA